jgi:PAS domain S-box-containing protein
MLDPSGNVVTWNSGAERFKGYTAAEIVGSYSSRFYAELPDGEMSGIARLNKPFLQAHLDHAIAEVMRVRH